MYKVLPQRRDDFIVDASTKATTVFEDPTEAFSTDKSERSATTTVTTGFITVTPEPTENIDETSKVPLSTEVLRSIFPETTTPTTRPRFSILKFTAVNEAELDEKLSITHTTPSIRVNCDVPYLDLVFVLDRFNSGSTRDLASNRFLLLDVLGSLVADPNIRVSVVSFSRTARTEIDFTSTQVKTDLFSAIENITSGPNDREANYARATEHALRVLNEGGRADAKAALVFFGDGKGVESAAAMRRAAQRIRNTPALVALAVDASKATDISRLAEYTTGGRENVFDYDHNVNFITRIEKLAMADRDCEEDLASAPNEKLEREGEKVIAAKTTTPSPARLQTFSRRTTTPRTTTTTGSASQEASGEENEEEKVEETTIRTTQERTERPRFRSTKPFFTAPQTTPTEETTTEVTTTTRRATTTIPFRPGCILDVMFIMDTSGSVGETFSREKEMAKNILHRFRIGPDNAKVSIIKFASKEKVRVLHSFDGLQTEEDVFASFDNVAYTSGTTALHTALAAGAKEFASFARPRVATQVALIFTDGYGEKDVTAEAEALRAQVQYVYALAIQHKHPHNTEELIKITGDPERVFTDANIDELENLVVQHSRGCKDKDSEVREQLRLL